MTETMAERICYVTGIKTMKNMKTKRLNLIFVKRILSGKLQNKNKSSIIS